MNKESDSSGDRRAVGSRFQVLGPYAAKLRWPVERSESRAPAGPRRQRELSKKSNGVNGESMEFLPSEA